MFMSLLEYIGLEYVFCSSVLLVKFYPIIVKKTCWTGYMWDLYSEKVHGSSELNKVASKINFSMKAEK